ncbi:MAG: Asp23/Gls24 family envelope stress response protein [Defluviitaleaceae bacterium]|nr:Asp23/Gls24 family envelope stress response protein [Defluviitaleaceae bacterium]
MNLKTELGIITIENEVIARIAGLAAMECYGVVGMAAKSIRDGLAYLLRRESLSKGVIIKPGENGELAIGLHIIVDYGTNLAAIADTLQSNVRYVVEGAVGIRVREVNIFIESVRTDRDA